MTMLMKQGILTWTTSPAQCGTTSPLPSLSRFSISTHKAQKIPKPSSSFTIFAAINGTHSNAGANSSHQREECKNGAFQLALLETFNFQGFSCPLSANAFIVANALMFIKPLEALAETCEAENSVFNMNMPLLLFVAIVGSTVGGLLARQRKGELQRLNEQLRQINAALKRQAKIESYAPSLSYAPVSGRIAESDIIVDPRKQDLIARLKKGKNFLRNQDPERAFSEFKTAFELAQNLQDKIEEKKAARGLGASLQRQGKFREAINYHSRVLEISEREGEESGSTEAYGAIADCYTELGDLERAAKYYDQYIARLQSD